MSANLVRVTNTQPRLLHLPDRVQVSDEAGKGPRINFLGMGKMLIPGGNNVEAHEWERALTKPAIQAWLELGWLVEGGDPTLPEGVEPPKTLAKYNIPDALDFISTQENAAVLYAWHEAEKKGAKRKQVLDALAQKAPKLPPIGALKK